MRVRDEVCGMMIEEDEAAGAVTYEGRTYHFCSARCLRNFDEHPDRYVATGTRRDEDHTNH